MELKKALDLQVQYYGKDGTVRVDENGYLCLNDLHAYFPQKRLQDWLDNKATQELIAAVEANLNHAKERDLKSPSDVKNLNARNSGYIDSAIITKRGRHSGGTFAHEIVAMDFAAWLSVEFKIHIYTSYINGTQQKQDWNIKRILAANNYKLMCEAIKNDHEPANHYHFSNEAKMLNNIVFGRHEPDIRDTATEAQLDAIAWLEGRNGAYIELGMEYQDRKSKLAEMYQAKYLPAHRELLEAS